MVVNSNGTVEVAFCNITCKYIHIPVKKKLNMRMENKTSMNILNVMMNTGRIA